MITSLIIIGLVWLFSGKVLERQEKERLIVWENIQMYQIILKWLL